MPIPGDFNPIEMEPWPTPGNLPYTPELARLMELAEASDEDVSSKARHMIDELVRAKEEREAGGPVPGPTR
jgi:hypothetical protein